MTAAPTIFRTLRGLVYRGSLKVMFRLRPERIHGLMARALHTAAGIGPVRGALRALFPVDDPVLSQRVAGLDFPRPLGLAAGFDKDATMADIWGPLGFGFAEVGTVTAVAQPGNPTPACSASPPTTRSSTGWGSTTMARWRPPGSSPDAVNTPSRWV